MITPAESVQNEFFDYVVVGELYVLPSLQVEFSLLCTG